MTPVARRTIDVLPAIAAAIALFVMGVYVAVINAQHNEVAVWFVAGVAIATVLALYGVVRGVPRREVALYGSGVLFVLLGVAGLLSVGLPLVVSGVLTIVAAGRSQRR
jgi:hypothetical protein